MVEFINGLVDEGADIVKTKKVTREAEAEWLSRYLADVEKGALIGVVAEVEGKAIGNSEVGKGMEAQGHVGFLGIAVSRGYRDLGIGARMMETLIGESRRAGLKLLVLDVAARNARAHHLYLKMGFKDAGTVPRMMLTRGEYGDVIRMYLEL
jgi:ribosomal protein S18 acetylase RimI-like enzyme